MTIDIVPQEGKTIAKILKPLTDYYDGRVRKLVYHLYSKGVTVQEIADTLGVTKQAVSVKYPKKGADHE
jgi:hypothetical protein